MARITSDRAACQALDLVVEAIEKAGYTDKIQIGMDVAAGEFLTEGAAI